MKEIGNTRLLVYEAVLSHSSNLARINTARSAIERAGGKLHVAPLRAGDMTLVTLTLPETHPPERFLPGLPFFPSTSR